MRHTREVQNWIRIGVATATLALLAGCGGTTVKGAVPAPPPASEISHKPARTATPSPTPPEDRTFTPGPAAVGFRGQEGAGSWQIKQFSWQQTANGSDTVPPQHGYLVLDIQITAIEGKVQVNPLYFTARTSDRTFAPTLGTDGNEPVLGSRELAPGESLGGLIVFDMPRTDVIVQINDELGSRIAEITIPAA